MTFSINFAWPLIGFKITLFQDKKKDESSDSLNSRESHKFCRVILPDNSTTVIPAKAGLTVRSSLQKLCERRHISLAAIDVFQIGSDKVSYSICCFHLIMLYHFVTNTYNSTDVYLVLVAPCVCFVCLRTVIKIGKFHRISKILKTKSLADFKHH